MKNQNYETLLLPTINDVYCIPVDAIVRVEASSSYSKVFCRDQALPIVASKVLRWFENNLPAQSFARVHRTHLVNKKYVVSVGRDRLRLETGLTVSISRRKKKKVMEGWLKRIEE